MSIAAPAPVPAPPAAQPPRAPASTATVWSVVRTELYKQLRRPRTYVIFGLMALIPVIITVALKLSPPDSGTRGILLQLAAHAGLFIPVAALRFTSTFLLVIVAAIFGGEAIAGEAQWGNLRYLLMRPISRGRLFTGKLIIAATSAFLAVTVVVLVGLVVGGIAFGFHSLSAPPGLRLGLFTPLSSGEVLIRLAFALAFVTWTLSSVLALSYMVGTMTDSTGGAIFAGIGLWITSSILDQIDSLGRIRYFLPTHYADSWADIFTHGHWSDDLWRSALVTLAYVVVFVPVAAWWFRRKDILS